MRLVDLGVMYLVLGLACAVAIYRVSPERGVRAVALSAIAVPLWPLWAPIALTSARSGVLGQAPAPSGLGSPSSVAETALRIEAVLREGVDASAGTSFETLLPRQAADRIVAEVRRAAARHAELEQLLLREGMDQQAAARRLVELTESGGSVRAIGASRLHLENVRRLSALRDRDASMLADLSELVRALRTQLVLARLTGNRANSGEDTFGILAETWARVESVGVALSEPGEADAAASAPPSNAAILS